ncbi:MAG: hypothetical protein ACLFVE_14140, partial [Chitinispirillaceae bacterium]
MAYLRTKPFLFCLIIIISLSSCFAKTKNSGETPMKNKPLTMTILDYPEKVISGGSIEFKIELENTSDRVLKVEQLAMNSPIKYIFKNMKSGGELIVSQEKFKSFMRGGRNIPRRKKQYVDLEPGKSLINREGDLCEYAIDPIPPGEYNVTALLTHEKQDVISDSVNIRICSPDYKDVKTLFSHQYQEAISIFIETSCFETPMLYHRQSFSTSPAIGAASIPFPVEEPVQGIANTESIGQNLPDRWVSYISGNKVIGACGDTYVKFKIFGSTETDLESPRLIPQGFMINENKGTFFLFGKNGATTKLQQVRFSEDGAEKKDAISLTDNEIFELKIQFNRESNHFNLLWIERSGAEYILKAGVYSPSEGTITGIHEFFRTDLSPVMLYLGSVVKNSERKNNYAALFVDSSNKMLTFVQSSYWSKEYPSVKLVPFPPGPSAEWSTAPSFDHNPLVITHSDGHLLWYEIDGDKQWRSFAHDTKGVSRLQLFTDSRNRYWAHWV